MTRAIPIWFGKTADTRVPDRVRLRIFARYEGRCQCGCYRKIMAGEPWQLDHKQALINGGPHAEDNLWPLLVEHHKAKTKRDVAEKSHVYERAKSHAGIKGETRWRPMLGTKASGIRKRMSGAVEGW